MLTSMTLGDYVRLSLGSYWPSLIVSSETEKTRTYPLSKLFSSFLEESGYMHLQMTKPDIAGTYINYKFKSIKIIKCYTNLHLCIFLNYFNHVFKTYYK